MKKQKSRNNQHRINTKSTKLNSNSTNHQQKTNANQQTSINTQQLINKNQENSIQHQYNLTINQYNQQHSIKLNKSINNESLSNQRQIKQKHPQVYLNTAATEKRIVDTRKLDETTLPFEFLLNQLRLKQAFTWDKFEATTGLSPAPIKQVFSEHVPEDWFLMDDQGLQLTDTGFLLSDDILQHFL